MKNGFRAANNKLLYLTHGICLGFEREMPANLFMTNHLNNK